MLLKIFDKVFGYEELLEIREEVKERFIREIDVWGRMEDDEVIRISKDTPEYAKLRNESAQVLLAIIGIGVFHFLGTRALTIYAALFGIEIIFAKATITALQYNEVNPDLKSTEEKFKLLWNANMMTGPRLSTLVPPILATFYRRDKYIEQILRKVVTGDRKGDLAPYTRTQLTEFQ